MKKRPLSTWDILRDNQTLRELLNRRRVEKGLTYSALSEATGIHYDNVRMYLSGKGKWKGITHYNLVRMAEFLGVEVSLNINLKY